MPPTEWKPEVGRAALGGVPEPPEPESWRLCRRRQDTAGMREGAVGAGALLASFVGGDPVLPVGVGGVSWAVLAAGAKSEKREIGRDPD